MKLNINTAMAPFLTLPSPAALGQVPELPARCAPAQGLSEIHHVSESPGGLAGPQPRVLDSVGLRGA